MPESTPDSLTDPTHLHPYLRPERTVKSTTGVAFQVVRVLGVDVVLILTNIRARMGKTVDVKTDNIVGIALGICHRRRGHICLVGA